ncbi:GNAT family N-acetyltransferase [Paenibacillus sp. MMS20-IR301]|uniref:GNAT family N-acetyltransferase n=1 Tax=Paenibacillus sp. MMS20-IR301 TaxID=2895946 RepID=UPI0028E8DA9E|nr:GNAT family N-acetyltransferase [Paenibacillus sp. MMS20-IR301]WNS44103.1 GNAT family N-acetyltransferase [Paenibacillus sp. MMS20-IR301]
MNIIELEHGQNAQQISRLLEEHSRRMDSSIPPYNREVISLAAYEEGTYIGGITGDMVWNILSVHLLAVDPAYRGGGLGRTLLAELEARARQHGCKVSELTTMSWQAPHFYQKLGYEIFGEIKDCPNEGQSKYYLQKSL